MLLLLRETPRNGYQLMQELEKRSHGAWRPSPGSVYPALQQQFGAALKQVVQTGTPAQIGAAQQLVDRARRDLYRILAGDRTGEKDPK